MAIKFGCLGDSGIDSHHGDEMFGGSYNAYTWSSVELLRNLRGFDMGAWGHYAEPRRWDYAYNWARYGVTSNGMIGGGQHTGLAAQVASGLVEYAYIKIGFNDYALYNPQYGNIYNGVLSGSALTSVENQAIADLTTAADTLLNAGILGIVGQAFPCPDDASAISSGFTNSPNRARVRNSVDRVNAGISAMYSARNLPYRDETAILLASIYLFSQNSHMCFEYGGQTIIADAADDDPHYIVISNPSGHAGTVLSALYANYLIIEPLNTRYGLGIKPLLPREVLTEAGIYSGPLGSIRRY